MNCPYCGNEMENGYIQCRDGVSWDTKIRRIAAVPSFRKDSVNLGSYEGAFSGSFVVAYNCRECKEIVIDY